MNQSHLQLLVSDGWREILRDYILPFAFGQYSPSDLGISVLEIGPGPGLTTDLVHRDVDKLTALELDADLAQALLRRLTGTNVAVVEGGATAMPFEPGNSPAQ